MFGPLYYKNVLERVVNARSGARSGISHDSDNPIRCSVIIHLHHPHLQRALRGPINPLVFRRVHLISFVSISRRSQKCQCIRNAAWFACGPTQPRASPLALQLAFSVYKSKHLSLFALFASHHTPDWPPKLSAASGGGRNPIRVISFASQQTSFELGAALFDLVLFRILIAN
ncbi:hypothetical protein L596_004892 [Steinernema carpocapsae]|uniref:Uncharacterized protein n=1 Tax=Steinernema carpocapsae TaxID=34508 RepID=A0A4U8UYU0_STECR|nr:hypothetical protein L596_004892 [Steinernema carpocapsae]